MFNRWSSSTKKDNEWAMGRFFRGAEEGEIINVNRGDRPKRRWNRQRGIRMGPRTATRRRVHDAKEGGGWAKTPTATAKRRAERGGQCSRWQTSAEEAGARSASLDMCA